MNSKVPLPNILLSAALAGLAITADQANAAITIFTEVADFSNNSEDPTDLLAQYTDFAVDSQVNGTLNSTNDSVDYFRVIVSPGGNVSLPFLFSGNAESDIVMFVTISRFGVVFAAATPNFASGESAAGTLNFIAPADGNVIFRLSHESTGSTLNYTIGAIPEPGTSVLGLAGLAAAALRRKRQP